MLSNWTHRIVLWRTGLVALLAICLLASIFLVGPGLPIDNSLRSWFLEEDTSYTHYHNHQLIWGNDDQLLVAIPFKDSVIGRPTMEMLRDMEAGLDSLPFVLDAVTIRSFRDYDLGTRSEVPLLRRLEDSLGTVTYQMRDESADIGEVFWNRARGYLMIPIGLRPVDSIEIYRAHMASDVHDVIRKHAPEYHLGGMAVMNEAINVATQEESLLFASLSALLIALVLWWTAPSIGYVLTGLATVALPVLYTLGIFVMMGEKANMMTSLLPTLIMVYGLGNYLHIFSYYRKFCDEYPDADKIDIIAKAVTYSFSACLFTSLTTMGGYLAIVSSQLRMQQTLGLYAFLGLAIALILVYPVTIIGLSWLQKPKARAHKVGEQLEYRFTQVYVRIFKTLRQRWRRPIIVVATLLLFGSFWGMTRVEMDESVLKYLPRHDKAYKDLQVITDLTRAYAPMEVIISQKEGKSMLCAEYLNDVAVFENRLLEDTILFNIQSLPRFWARIGKTAPVDLQAPPCGDTTRVDLQAAIPENYRPYLDAVTNTDNTQWRISGRVPVRTAEILIWRIKAVERAFAEIIAPKHPELSMRIDGYAPLYLRLTEYLTKGQISSLLWAYIISFGLLGLFFRNIKLSFVGFLVNALPVSLVLAAFSLVGFTLDAGAMLVGPIVLGVVLDDTIHYMHNFLACRKEGKSVLESIETGIARSGSGVTLTFISLLAGFGILMFSDMYGLFTFGWMSCLMLLVAWAADIILLPLWLYALYRNEDKKKGS